MYRLYRAYFGREPDGGGFWFWVDRLEDGSSLEAISDQFATSPEFIETFGALDDGAFVDQAYSSVFGRIPDADGREFWLARMEAGTTRGEVMIAFSDSTEYQIQLGFVSQPAIERLYRAVFLRDADRSGLRFWSDRASSGQFLTEIATAMVASDEFVTRYGALNDAEFVDQIYLNVLDRAPDASGGPFWLEQLQQGVPRGVMVWEFSASPENQTVTGLVDPPIPVFPTRPGSEPPPIAPVLPTFILAQPPLPVPGTFDPQQACEFRTDDTLVQQLDDETTAIYLRFTYWNSTACNRSLGIPVMALDGPTRSLWDYQGSEYLTSDRFGVYYIVTFHLPTAQVPDAETVEFDAWIQTNDHGRIQWSGPIAQ